MSELACFKGYQGSIYMKAFGEMNIFSTFAIPTETIGVKLREVVV